MTTPTTTDERLEKVLKNASGFIYYVSIAGITGTASAQHSDVQSALARIRKQTDLPLQVGLFMKSAEQVRATGEYADAVVVGSAIINIVRQCHEEGLPSKQTLDKVSTFVSELASGCKPRS